MSLVRRAVVIVHMYVCIHIHTHTRAQSRVSFTTGLRSEILVVNRIVLKRVLLKWFKWR